MAPARPFAHSHPCNAPTQRKEDIMGIAGKTVLSLAVLAAIGILVAYEAPRLVKA